LSRARAGLGAAVTPCKVCKAESWTSKSRHQNLRDTCPRGARRHGWSEELVAFRDLVGEPSSTVLVSRAPLAGVLVRLVHCACDRAAPCARASSNRHTRARLELALRFAGVRLLPNQGTQVGPPRCDSTQQRRRRTTRARRSWQGPPGSRCFCLSQTGCHHLVMQRGSCRMQSESSAPSLSAPSLLAPSLSAPSLSAPSLSAPSLSAPSLSESAASLCCRSRRCRSRRRRHRCQSYRRSCYRSEQGLQRAAPSAPSLYAVEVNRRVRPSRCALDCSSASTLFGGRQRHSRDPPPSDALMVTRARCPRATRAEASNSKRGNEEHQKSKQSTELNGKILATFSGK
jgi:hypothetical protein